jgi:hypothetical protein
MSVFTVRGRPAVREETSFLKMNLLKKLFDLIIRVFSAKESEAKNPALLATPII